MNNILVVLAALIVYVLLDILFFGLALAIVGSIRDPHPWARISMGIPGEIEYAKWEKIAARVFGPIITLLYLILVFVVFLWAFGIALYHWVSRGQFAVDLDYSEEK